MISTLIFAWLLAQAPNSTTGQMRDLPGIDTPHTSAVLYIPDDRMTEVKYSPKQQWPFEWIISGMGRITPGESAYHLRIRVFAQLRKETNDPSIPVTRMAMRLWEYNYKVLKLDHAEAYNSRIVDFYLCWGGTPGGEQLFGEDEEAHIKRKVNTIYIYDIPSFTNPLEMAREVAHEYGHATLPAVGGFKEPECWANGFLGERLYLRWLRDQLKAEKLTSDDVIGTPLKSLDDWVQNKVDPLVNDVATNGPRLKLLSQTTSQAFDAYLGLVLYANSILPSSAFARSLKLTGSQSAKDYPAAIISSLEESAPTQLKIPKNLIGNTIWIPLGMCRLSGIKPIAKAKGWAKIKPTRTVVQILPSVQPRVSE